MDSFEQHLGSQSEPDPCQDLVVTNEAVQADDDERLYLELVENWGTFGRDEEEDIFAQFEDTDEEEKEENNVMGVGEHEEVEDRPIISYDRENPSLTEGSIFPSIVDYRNALATFCIKGEFDFDIDKSDQTRLTVHCTNLRGKRMHASKMRNRELIQVKVNHFPHTCSSAERKETQKVAKSRWCADAMKEWVTENPCIGPTALIKKIYEKYNIKVSYMRVYYGKEMALDKIYGP
jgi:hypothetical protein